jgi:branched-chain amino acid aminotransferase/para-aminobenzoate synthetase component 1
VVVWLQGRLTPLAEARISPLDRGLLYGDGLFTTLRAQDGRALHLEPHLERLAASAEALRLAWPRGLDWAEAIAGLLKANGLAGPGALARVKLVLTRGEAPGLGLPEGGAPTLLMLAAPYAPPSPEAYAAGLRLRIFRAGHAPPLAAHKSLNYLYYLLARQAAMDEGGDEAVILGPAGEVCEAAMGSLLVHDGQGWSTPESPWRLPGVTLELARGLLAEMGQAVTPRPLRPEDLMAAQTVWVLGSLMGVMPVAEVEGRTLPARRAELAAELRAELCARG